MKICSKCKVEKSKDEFHKRANIPSGLKSWCKICSKEHEQNKSNNDKKERYKKLKENEKVRRLKLFDKLREYTDQKGGCQKCGEKDYVVLEFDHRDRESKEFPIAEGVGKCMSWERLLQELSKCDILCANCHRRKTAEEMNWYK